MKIEYDPSKDELILKIHPANEKPNKKSGPFKLWWDDEGNICALAIEKYREESEEFRKNLIQLRGIWRGVKITDEELEELECIRAYDAAKASNDEVIPFEQATAEIERDRQ